ncbi:MAG: peptidase [Planctomycetaceae bacterium]|nr:peptidase [Planctomycetaceae bacterium]
MKTILMPIGDAAEVLDTFYPMFRLREEGYRVVVAGPEARPYNLVLHEKPAGWDITQESKGYMLTADTAFRDVNPAELAGMVITGGRAPEYLRYDEDLLRITKALFAANKPVASVCHGIEILAAADVIRGKEVTTVAKCKLDCEFSGGIYLDREVLVTGNLVTCRTWHDNPAWMREFFRLLRNQ